MKKMLFTMAVLAGSLLGWEPVVAQCNQGNLSGGGGGYGMTQPVCTGGVCQGAPRFGLHDHYSPHPFYAYGRGGVNASWENVWNQNQAQTVPWHGGYRYWRWGTPTALVVPPTAAFQTSYAWGVGQTQSMPIYHQFNKAIGGGGMGDPSQFAPTPYWPSHTGQFGVYPVRGPWN